MIKKAFVHLFKTTKCCYLYDVNTDVILKIPEEVYCYLKSPQEETTEYVQTFIEKLIESGYLKSTRVKITKHPTTDLLPFYLNSRVDYLVLQITQNCNLRCDYCVYSGGYKTREHSNIVMTFEMAKASIDYMIEHSSDSMILTVGFYGGEPLLEFDLIKKCVEYIKKSVEGKKIEFSITTNGTLLSESIIDFMIQENFHLCISLDGPKEIHNRNRKFANSDVGSYDYIIRNIEKIKNRNPDYYRERVVYSTVMSGNVGFGCVNEYFMKDILFENNLVLATTVSMDFAKKIEKVEEKFIEEYNYECFKLFLARKGRINSKNVSSIVKQEFNTLIRWRENKTRGTRRELPETWHRGGPCIPGIRSLFVNAYGEFFPCEKVCEVNGITNIGNIEHGIDIKKVEKLLNIEKYTEEKCRDCWAYAYCGICIQCSDGIEKNLENDIERKCEQMKKKVEDAFCNYCVLEELSD